MGKRLPESSGIEKKVKKKSFPALEGRIMGTLLGIVSIPLAKEYTTWFFDNWKDVSFPHIIPMIFLTPTYFGYNVAEKIITYYNPNSNPELVSNSLLLYAINFGAWFGIGALIDFVNNYRKHRLKGLG